MLNIRIMKSNYMATTILACLLIAYGIGGSTSEYANSIQFALTASWFVLTLATDSSRLIKTFYNPSVKFCILFLFLYLMDVFLRNDMVIGIKCLGLYICIFSPLFLYCYYKQLDNKYYIKLIVSFSLLVVGFYCMKALFFYTFHEGAARLLASNRRYFGTVSLGGGYSLAYLNTLLVVYFLGSALRHKRYLFLLCMGLITVFKTESTITTLTMLGGMGLDICWRVLQRLNKRRDRVVFLLVIISIPFIMLLMKNPIGKFLVSYFGGWYHPFGWRMTEIGNLLLGNTLGNESATNLRLITYFNSLNIIRDNPILGELWSHGVVLNTGNTGGHSDILDAIAGWGIFYGSIYLNIFVFWFIRLKKSKRNYAYIIVLAIMMLFNPCINFHTCLAIFLIIPSFDEYFMQELCIRKLYRRKALMCPST